MLLVCVEMKFDPICIVCYINLHKEVYCENNTRFT